MINIIPQEIDLRLSLIRCRLERAVLERQAAKCIREEELGEFSGLVISEKEILSLLNQKNSDLKLDPEEVKKLDSKMINIRKQLLALPPEESLFDLLRFNFNLSETEAYICLFVCAPELDRSFEKTFAFLQDNLNLKRPEITLVGEIFFGHEYDGTRLRQILGPGGSLIASRLVQYSERSRREQSSFFSRQLVPSESLVEFWVHNVRLDKELREIARLQTSVPAKFYEGYYSKHKTWVQKQLARQSEIRSEFDSIQQVEVLLGPNGLKLHLAIENVAYELNRRVLSINMETLLDGHPGRGESLWYAIIRETILWSALLHLDFSGITDQESARQVLRQIPVSLYDNSAVKCYVTAQAVLLQPLRGLPVPVQIETFHLPTRMQRKELWECAWNKKFKISLSHEDISALSTHFNFTPEDVENIVQIADERKISASGEVYGELANICRNLKSHHLNQLAVKLRCLYRWEDLVLPPDVLEQLREICESARLSSSVYDDWGFGEKFSQGKGLSILFSGESGTGKTMCAEIIAGTLGLELFKIDLSLVVSKYIGETEKNLTRIFQEAENCNGILLFDEADALFGKRSEVKDAHDRYANIEIDHLLQKLEEHEGIVILTTNILQNIDSAFTRRLKYIVEFPTPDQNDREIMWNKVFPGSAPRSERIDYEFLSKQFRLTGANIKNIALNGAFLAASNGGCIEMFHIIKAVKREFQKMGKYPGRSDFGPYYELVKEASLG